MGFEVDIVGFGLRQDHEQEHLEQRLRELMWEVIAAVGLEDPAITYHGDGMRVIMRPDADPARALTAILTTTSRLLMNDNRRFRDTMRLRMVLDFGLARHTPYGAMGNLAIGLSRLIGCWAIRKAVIDHKERGLVALVSNRLCELVKPGRLVLEQVAVVEKEYTGTAWLWLWSSGAVA